LRNQSISYELMLASQFLGMHEAACCRRRTFGQGARLIDQRKLSIIVSRVLSLAEVAGAHRLIETGSTTGKIVPSIN